MKRRPNHPTESKNKPKVPFVAPGPSAPSANASSPPPKLFLFFCIAGPQCREIQRLPLNFTKFMDGRELREAVLREHSGGGSPYEVEVWYDSAGEQYFKGGWSQFAGPRPSSGLLYDFLLARRDVEVRREDLRLHPMLERI
jgi:hypothetical protein